MPARVAGSVAVLYRRIEVGGVVDRAWRLSRIAAAEARFELGMLAAWWFTSEEPRNAGLAARVAKIAVHHVDARVDDTDDDTAAIEPCRRSKWHDARPVRSRVIEQGMSRWSGPYLPVGMRGRKAWHGIHPEVQRREPGRERQEAVDLRVRAARQPHEQRNAALRIGERMQTCRLTRQTPQERNDATRLGVRLRAGGDNTRGEPE